MKIKVHPTHYLQAFEPSPTARLITKINERNDGIAFRDYASVRGHYELEADGTKLGIAIVDGPDKTFKRFSAVTNDNDSYYIATQVVIAGKREAGSEEEQKTAEAIADKVYEALEENLPEDYHVLRKEGDGNHIIEVKRNVAINGNEAFARPGERTAKAEIIAETLEKAGLAPEGLGKSLYNERKKVTEPAKSASAGIG